MFHRVSLCVLLLVLSTKDMVFAQPPETVSLVGKNVQTSDTKAVGILLVLNGQKWSKLESSNHYFNTKSGVYKMIAINVVILRDPTNTTRIGELDNLTPSAAKKGDTGTGGSDETGIAFTWEVQ
jgi:hypothetical protein